MESSGAIIDRVMREQQKQIQELQQQKKQLIKVMQGIKEYAEEKQSNSVYLEEIHYAASDILDQIQAKDDRP